MVNKERIQKKFSQSTGTYNSEARAQKIIINEMVQWMRSKHFKNFDSVLEIGSGTGMLTELLLDNFKINTLEIIDLVPETCELGKNLSTKYPDTIIKPIISDAEKTIFKTQYDLIISSSTFHWLNDFEAFSKQVSENIKNGGWFIFSTYGTENLGEIQEISNAGLPYIPFTSMRALLEKKYHIENCFEEKIELTFQSPQAVLTHFKKTGINGNQNNVWTKSKYLQFISEYNHKFRTGDSVRLTYHPMYFFCKKIN